MEKYTVSFQIESENTITNGQVFGIEDLLITAALPALNLKLVPLTLEVEKSKK
jgi:hypothetical protein